MSVAEQTEQLIDAMLDGALTDEEATRHLVSMAARGETAEEIFGATRAVMARAIPFEAPESAVDMCGTGGDGKQTYNISTSVAFVTAAAGVPVVKHGNRGVSSRSGSSDVLSALGIPNSLSRDFWQRSIAVRGIAFLHAPQFHPGLVRMAPLRRAIGTRTIFNVLGPLCNPAQVKRQLMGVYSSALVPVIAEVMYRRAMDAAWVVHGSDGGDELSISGESDVAMLTSSSIQRTTLIPADAGLTVYDSSELTGGTPEENAGAMLDLFAGERSAYRDSVLLNSAGVLMVAGKVASLMEGVMLASEAIDSGRAFTLVAALKEDAMKEPYV